MVEPTMLISTCTDIINTKNNGIMLLAIIAVAFLLFIAVQSSSLKRVKKFLRQHKLLGKYLEWQDEETRND